VQSTFYWGFFPATAFYIVAKRTKAVKQLLKPKLMAIRFVTPAWRVTLFDEIRFVKRLERFNAVMGVRGVGESPNENKIVTFGKESVCQSNQAHCAQKDGIPAALFAATTITSGRSSINGQKRIYCWQLRDTTIDNELGGAS
jgi:hypothetical protein